MQKFSQPIKNAVVPYVVIIIVVFGGVVTGIQIDQTTLSNSFDQDSLKIINATRLEDTTRNGLIDRIELTVKTGSKEVIMKDVIVYSSGEESQWVFEKKYSLPSHTESKIHINPINSSAEIDSYEKTNVFLIYSLLGDDDPLVTSFEFITPYVEPRTSFVFGVFYEPGQSTGLVGANQSLFLQERLGEEITELDENYGVRIIQSQDVLRGFIDQVSNSSRNRYLIFVQDKIPKFLLSRTESPQTKLGEFFLSGGHLMFIGGRPLFETYSNEGDVSYADAAERVFNLSRIIGTTLISSRSAFIRIFDNSTTLLEPYYHQAAYPVVQSYLELQKIEYLAYGGSDEADFLEPVITFFPSAMATFAYSGLISKNDMATVISNSLALLRVMIFEWSKRGVQ